MGIRRPLARRFAGRLRKGVGLVKLCNEKLTGVERKVEVLVKDKEGKLQLKPFEDSEEEDEE